MARCKRRRLERAVQEALTTSRTAYLRVACPVCHRPAGERCDLPALYFGQPSHPERVDADRRAA